MHLHPRRTILGDRPPAVCAILVAAGLLAAMTGASHASERARQETHMADQTRQTGKKADARGVKGLPYADADRAFSTLDEYLAHRAFLATIGIPTLRETSPGRYVEEAADGQVRRYTRQQLLKMFGFTR